MKVLFLPEVQEYYDNLEQILYEKGYISNNHVVGQFLNSD